MPREPCHPPSPEGGRVPVRAPGLFTGSARRKSPPMMRTSRSATWPAKRVCPCRPFTARSVNSSPGEPWSTMRRDASASGYLQKLGAGPKPGGSLWDQSDDTSVRFTKGQQVFDQTGPTAANTCNCRPPAEPTHGRHNRVPRRTGEGTQRAHAAGSARGHIPPAQRTLPRGFSATGGMAGAGSRSPS